MADQFPNTDVYEICPNCSAYRFIGEKCASCDMAADPKPSSDDDDSDSEEQSALEA